MPEHHFRFGPLFQHVYFLIASHPVIMVSSQPPLWYALVIILMNVVPNEHMTSAQCSEELENWR